MTDESIALRELREKSADADLRREMIAFAAERPMELEVQVGYPLLEAGARLAGQMPGSSPGMARRGWASVASLPQCPAS
jgi:hypothetical protein